MTACADCGTQVDRRRAVIYLTPDGTEALTLCGSCKVTYDSKRQYHPSNGPPTQTRFDLRDRGRDEHLPRGAV